MRIYESPIKIPAHYFYPLLIMAFLLSWIFVLVKPYSGSYILAFVMTLAVTALIINYLILLSGFGSRIRTQNLLKLSAELIKIDNKIDTKEKSRILDSLIEDFPKFLAKKRFKKFEKYLNQVNDLEPVLRDLRKYPNRFKIRLVRSLVQLAITDKFLSQKEDEFLRNTVKKIGIPSKFLESILSLHFYVHENEKTHNSNLSQSANYTLIKSYSVLGLEPNSSFIEVKKAYRDLVKIYHPDKVRNKMLKENAVLRFQAITDAYETIKKEKG